MFASSDCPTKLWLPILLTFLCIVLACGTGTQDKKTLEQRSDTKAKNFTLVELKPSDGELESLLKAEVKKAKEAGRKPFVELYADWCAPCKALRNSLDDARMIDAFDGTYIIQLNSDMWNDKLSGMGFSANTIPVFFEINEDVKSTGRRISGGAWGANTPPNMAPPLKKFFKG